MTNINDRRESFENKFRVDAEARFRIHARIVRRLAFWTAEEMGMDVEAEKDYATKIVDIMLAEGFEAALQHLHDDFMSIDGAEESNFTAARMEIEQAAQTA